MLEKVRYFKYIYEVGVHASYVIGILIDYIFILKINIFIMNGNFTLPEVE